MALLAGPSPLEIVEKMFIEADVTIYIFYEYLSISMRSKPTYA